MSNIPIYKPQIPTYVPSFKRTDAVKPREDDMFRNKQTMEPNQNKDIEIYVRHGSYTRNPRQAGEREIVNDRFDYLHWNPQDVGKYVDDYPRTGIDTRSDKIETVKKETNYKYIV